jgi:hypothetical protein
MLIGRRHGPRATTALAHPDAAGRQVASDRARQNVRKSAFEEENCLTTEGTDSRKGALGDWRISILLNPHAASYPLPDFDEGSGNGFLPQVQSTTAPSYLHWQPRCPPYRRKMSANPILAKYRYRRRLPHIQKADAVLFITFCTGGRRVLPKQARDLILEHCLREGGFRGSVARAPSPAMIHTPRIHLHAVVVMPDHVHLLLTPVRDGRFHSWTFCNASKERPHIVSTNCSEHQVQSGKKNHSIMCCGRMRV